MSDNEVLYQVDIPWTWDVLFAEMVPDLNNE